MLKKKLNLRTILILVESLPGALRSGRFVLEHLYNDQDQIILLQVYRVQGYGIFLMRNLSEKLRNISMEELTMLKNTLTKEFGISPDKIQKLAIEGDLATTLKHEFYSKNINTLVIGDDHNVLKDQIPYSQISTIMKTINKRPIFYINDNITLIGHRNILTISDELNKISDRYKIFLTNLSKLYKTDIEYITINNESSVLITDDQKQHPPNAQSIDIQRHKTIKKILENWDINFSSKNEINS